MPIQLTFVVKAIDAIDAGTFMVATKNKKVFWIFNFVGEQQTNGFQRLFASIHIIAEKQVISFGREPAVLKQPE